jgi:vitamin B12 transporter
MFGANSSMILTYFGRESENLIEFDMESPNFGRYKNIADSHVNGVELEWRLAWDRWSLDMSGTYLDAVNDTPDDSGAVRFEGKRLPNRPEWAGSARLTRSFDRGSAYVEIQYTGENYGDSSEKTFFDARTVWNAGIKYSFSPRARLFIGVDDIFDTAKDWKLRPVENGPTRILWYPTEGRYFYATFEYLF